MCCGDFILPEFLEHVYLCACFSICEKYYTLSDKELYAMSIIFDFSYTKKMERRLDNLIFRIYKVEIEKVKEE